MSEPGVVRGSEVNPRAAAPAPPQMAVRFPVFTGRTLFLW